MRRCKDVVGYRDVWKYTLQGVTLSLDCGVYVLQGPNGAGKTTLLKLAAGILKPARGAVSVFDLDPFENHHVRAYINYVATRPLAPLNTSVYDYLLFYKLSSIGGNASIEDALEAVGLSPQTSRMRLQQLSQGQQRKVELAKLVLLRAPIVLVDEPFLGLDKDARRMVADLLEGALKYAEVVMIASHDDEIVARLGARVVRVEKGRAYLEDNYFGPGGGKGHYYRVYVGMRTRSLGFIKKLKSMDNVAITNIEIDTRRIIEWLGVDGANVILIDESELDRLRETHNVSVMHIDSFPFEIDVNITLSLAKDALRDVIGIILDSGEVYRLDIDTG